MALANNETGFMNRIRSPIAVVTGARKTRRSNRC